MRALFALVLAVSLSSPPTAVALDYNWSWTPDSNAFGTGDFTGMFTTDNSNPNTITALMVTGAPDNNFVGDHTIFSSNAGHVIGSRDGGLDTYWIDLADTTGEWLVGGGILGTLNFDKTQAILDTFTGMATIVGGTGSYTPKSVVPEPTTWMLFATGSLGLAGYRWHQRRRERAQVR